MNISLESFLFILFEKIPDFFTERLLFLFRRRSFGVGRPRRGITVKLPQQIFLAFRHAGRDFYLQCDDLVPSDLRVTQVRYTYAAEGNHCIRLCTGFDGIFLFPINGLDGNFSAQCCLYECDGHITVNIVAFTNKDTVGLYVNAYQQIAVAAAVFAQFPFAAQTNGLTCLLYTSPSPRD